MIQHGFVETTEFERVAKFSLYLLPKPVMSHSADEVGAELRGTLLRANDLESHFSF